MNTKLLGKVLMPLALTFGLSFEAIANIPKVPEVKAKSYVLMEHETGRILNSLNENKKLAPASLTKVMTAYVVFDELESGRLALEDNVKISKKAWETGGSRTFVKEGTLVTVDDLIKGTIIQSGNDAATALAEHISGSDKEFAVLMNYHAKKIGMTNSKFKNPTGLPSRDHYSTAKDLAVLTRSMINRFPSYYYIYQMKKFTYADITQDNRNHLLKEDLGFDGLKTGYTKNAGYCYIGAAKRGETRMIVTLLDEPSPAQRFEDAKKLVNYGFRFYETHKLLVKEQPISELTTDVIFGKTDLMRVGSNEDLVLVLEKDQYKKIEYKVNLIAKATAPISIGTIVGDINIVLDDEVLASVELIALDEIEKGSVFKQLKDKIKSYF